MLAQLLRKNVSTIALFLVFFSGVAFFSLPSQVNAGQCGFLGLIGGGCQKNGPDNAVCTINGAPSSVTAGQPFSFQVVLTNNGGTGTYSESTGNWWSSSVPSSGQTTTCAGDAQNGRSGPTYSTVNVTNPTGWTVQPGDFALGITTGPNSQYFDTNWGNPVTAIPINPFPAGCTWGVGVTATAPPNPGPYSMTFQMFQSNVMWFGSSCSTNITVTPPACASNSGQTCYSNPNSCGQTNLGTIQCNGSCSVSATPPPDSNCPVAPPVDNAACAGFSAPSAVTPGQSFQASTYMYNSGNTTWTSAMNYKLGSQNPQDNGTWGTGRVALPYDVPPSSFANFNGTFTAPTTPGTYPFSWEMLQEGVKWFGATCSQNITVSAPANTPPEGYFDGADCNSLSGWAYDPDSPGTSIYVDVYKDGPAGSGTGVGRYLANVSRPDVNAALGVGGNYGYSIATPNSLKDGAAHSLYIYGIDTAGGPNTLLTNSPKTISGCSPPPPTGTIYVSSSPNPCIIPAGSNACTSAITWSTTNTPSADVYVGSGHFASATSGTQDAPWITYTPTTFVLKDSSGNVLATMDASGVCASGTVWDGSHCNTPPPDLTAGATTLSPTPGFTGQSESFSAPVSNIGSGPASNFPNIFQIDNSSLSATVAMVGATTVSSLAPGASTSISGAYTFASAGTYNVRACANFNTSWAGSIPESNPSNNCGAWQTVTIAYPVPTATLIPAQTIIDSGQSATLHWNATNATSCTSGGFPTGGATTGSASVSPSTTSNYQVSCTGPGGTVSSNIATVTVRVPTVSIGATPTRVPAGGSITVSWTASNVNTCTIMRNGVLWKTLPADSSRALSGSASDTITTQTTYVISCTNNASSSATAATATQIVNVLQSFREF